MKDSHISVSRMFTQKGLCMLWKGGHKTILEKETTNLQKLGELEIMTSQSHRKA
jgi:hypothetical protein